MLIVNIAVNDVNDNPPIFDYPKYETGISPTDSTGKVLFIPPLHASDADLNDRITYHILTETMMVTNEVLESYKDSAFLLDQNSGILTLNFQVQTTLSGSFKFKVEARDLADHTATTDVIVRIISESSRFLFINTVEEVAGANQQTLRNIFSEQYQAECITTDIESYKNEDGIANVTMTVYEAHFIKDEDVVNASYIERYEEENQN